MILTAARAAVTVVMSAIGTQNMPPNDPPAIATEVRRISAAKCNDCHGDHLPKPKDKFGYVLDLSPIAGIPKMVMPGNPHGSELVQDELPGQKSGLAMTNTEQDLFRQWILTGDTVLHGHPPHLRYGFHLILVAGNTMIGLAGSLGASLAYGVEHYAF